MPIGHILQQASPMLCTTGCCRAPADNRHLNLFEFSQKQRDMQIAGDDRSGRCVICRASSIMVPASSTMASPALISDAAALAMACVSGALSSVVGCVGINRLSVTPPWYG